MRRSLPHLLWGIGLVLIIIGTVLGPGVFIPGEQPTPQMLAQLRRQLIFSNSGLALCVIGVIWLISRRLVKHFSRKNTP